MSLWSKLKTNYLAILSASTASGYVLYEYNKKQKPSFCQQDCVDSTWETDYLKKNECDKLIKRYQLEYGAPGVVVAVSENGRILYARGYGYSDVENNVKAHAHTACRIASISKPITTAIAAKLYENGKLDFDKPIATYLNEIPPLKYKNKQYDITTRQLACHMSGVRHYEKTLPVEDVEEAEAVASNAEKVTNISTNGNTPNSSNTKTEKSKSSSDKNSKIGDTKYEEFYTSKNFKTTNDALETFIHDELLYEPGTRFLYTTHGYTLLSAVLEKASGGKNNDFRNLFAEVVKFMDMSETYLDENDPLIHNRSKYYTINDKKRLSNVPYVDNSLKWAGGGMLSTVLDLTKFGNHMLFCYQNSDVKNKQAFLKASTIKNFLWSPHCIPKEYEKRHKQARPPLTDASDTIAYGLGWNVCLDVNKKLKYVYHTGGAVGAVSCLLVVPNDKDYNSVSKLPRGLVVVVFCNCDNASEISKLCLKIANIFKDN